MNKWFFYLLTFLGHLCLYVQFMSGQECDSRSLSFQTAVERVLKESPDLKIINYTIKAKAGEYEKASVYPNPIFTYELEPCEGSRDWRSWRRGESTYALSQLIEMGGKRSSRQRLAAFQYYASALDYDIMRNRVMNELIKTFVQALASQELIKLACEQKALIDQGLQITKIKKELGKECLIQEVKAQLECSTAELAEEQAQTQFEIDKERLAALWGCNCPDFDCVDYPFYEIEGPSSLCDYLQHLSCHPEFNRIQLDYLAAKESVCLEKSFAIPDIVLTVGYVIDRDCREGERGLVLGVEVPLPLFDRNQGGIKRAYANVDRARLLSERICSLLKTKLKTAYREWLLSYKEVQTLKDDILASACQSCCLAEEGHKEGKFDYRHVLEVRQAMLAIKEKYIRALMNYHQRKADVEYLTIQSDRSSLD